MARSERRAASLPTQWNMRTSVVSQVRGCMTTTGENICSHLLQIASALNPFKPLRHPSFEPQCQRHEYGHL